MEKKLIKQVIGSELLSFLQARKFTTGTSPDIVGVQYITVPVLLAGC